MKTSTLASALLVLALAAPALLAQNAPSKPRPEDTDVWAPEPPVVTPGQTSSTAPSDAIILFDGHDLDQWVAASDHQSPANWIVADGIVTVNKKAGNMETRRKFKNYQFHLEYRIPADIEGSGQERGNSGLFLASTGKGDKGYELQILDSYQNRTYVNGMAGAVYKQYIPLANACRKPGEWQSYDVVWIAPLFNDDGTVKSPARLTAFFNGILIQNDVTLQGETFNVGKPAYFAYDRAPIKLQAHPDHSKPMSFRNIWVRELP
jgi:Domain of Unknown Function (DUF1080)